MREHTKSILESLVDLSSSQDTSLIIESRGTHIISSAIKLIETIRNNYGEELAENMEKRLLLSIKNKDSKKFSRAMKNLKS